MARVTGTLALVLAGMMVGGGGKVASSRGVVNNKFFTFTPLSLRSDGERKMKPCCVSWPGGTYQAADGTITGSGDETFDGKLVVDGTSGWIRSIKGWTCAQSFCVHVASGNWTIADCGMKVEGGNTMPAAIVQTDRDASVLLQDCDLNGAWSAGVRLGLLELSTVYSDLSRCLVRDCHMQAKLGAICTKTEDCRCDVDEYSQFDGPKIFVAPSATLSNLPDLNDFPPPAGLQQVAESSGAFTHSLQEYVEREVMAAKDHAVVTKNLSSWEYVDLVLSKVSANLSECPPELQEKLVRKWEELFLSPVDEERSAGILDGLAPEDERFQQWRSAFKLTSSLQRQMIASAMLHMDSLRQRNASRDMVHEEEIPQRDLYQLLQGKGNGEAAEDGFIKWRPNRKLSAREEAERKKRIFWSTLKLINETSPHDLQLVKSLSSWCA
ncbi:hypothetical protein GUITHDRAFT_134457 [Guillardia theta CCMP2712]|uniref:Right handed beta helix domain-containing protein n=1 Tax=Guillardia theta (strain CCMP2712) TaxID=905079 RepID=L1JTA1_GUITC|nr:hypothetical protein GUITHDRAFT_134457 [Guillardia theta CCMP2712]EKX51549.1 hypothetical protein GUITHDRAFT_134457 [Guillardia theta CCMP2712]|eukprot:XP_005838529.1 hypothetical protein GUITHDRAFT_134457 [Guillardia theta CCMP2712]